VVVLAGIANQDTVDAGTNHSHEQMLDEVGITLIIK
jgi:hypothetical protein